MAVHQHFPSNLSWKGSARKNKINCPNPGVQSLQRFWKSNFFLYVWVSCFQSLKLRFLHMHSKLQIFKKLYFLCICTCKRKHLGKLWHHNLLNNYNGGSLVSTASSNYKFSAKCCINAPRYLHLHLSTSPALTQTASFFGFWPIVTHFIATYQPFIFMHESCRKLLLSMRGRETCVETEPVPNTSFLMESCPQRWFALSLSDRRQNSDQSLWVEKQRDVFNQLWVCSFSFQVQILRVAFLWVLTPTRQSLFISSQGTYSPNNSLNLCFLIHSMQVVWQSDCQQTHLEKKCTSRAIHIISPPHYHWSVNGVSISC